MSTASTVASAIAKAVTVAANSPSVDVSLTAVAPVTAAVTASVVPVIEHLTNNEPWYQSRVTWGAIISAVVPILGAFGIATDWIKPDEFAAVIVAVGGVVGAATTLYGRWKARKPIGA